MKAFVWLLVSVCSYFSRRVTKMWNFYSNCNFLQCPLFPFREGNGTPLQYSCLENPMDGGAWWGYSPGGRRESDMTERRTGRWFQPCTSLDVWCIFTGSVFRAGSYGWTNELVGVAFPGREVPGNHSAHQRFLAQIPATSNPSKVGC